MNRFALSTVLFSLTLAATAQTGRSMRLAAPAVLGHTARFELRHLTAAAGNLYCFLWSSPPFAGTQVLNVPGFAVRGLARIDPAAAQVAFSGVLTASGRTAHDLPLANSSHLLGFAFDLQALDLEANTSTLAFADDDLAITVAQAPPGNLVLVAPGTFSMGSTYAAAEQPVHAVTISRPFWMGRYEVTQAEFQAVLGYNPSFFRGPNRPVEATWNAAVAYCNALNGREANAGRVPSGYRYRLPTEAEWEYACRAGTTTAYHSGTSITCADANAYHDMGVGFCLPHPTEGGQTADVGTYPPNAWGLHDMHGNVWEWCQDRWPGPISTYPSGAVTDPVENNPLFVYRVLRGGAWDFYRDAARSASRNGNLADTQVYFYGFRVVLGPIL